MQRRLPTEQLVHTKRRLLSSTAQGTAYEQHCLRFLRHALPTLATDLERTGKAGDQGVDITGRLFDRTLVIQCKSTKAVVGPSTIRELEGTLVHRASSKPLGVLFGAGGFAPGTCQRCVSSEMPLILLHLPAPLLESEAGDRASRDRLVSVLLSRTAQQIFSERVDFRRALDADGRAFVRLMERAN